MNTGDRHVVNECYVNGSWVMIDLTSNILFTVDEKGKPLGLTAMMEQIKTGKSVLIYSWKMYSWEMYSWGKNIEQQKDYFPMKFFSMDTLFYKGSLSKYFLNPHPLMYYYR